MGAAQRLYVSCVGESQHFWVALKQPARCPELTRLTLGVLAKSTARVSPTTLPVGAPTPPGSTAATKGRFYYIATGVGCGIEKAEEVRVAGFTCPIASCGSEILCTDRLRVQEGYLCVGACEIDEYCQQVCALPSRLVL
jgi:hypothetical protein